MSQLRSTRFFAVFSLAASLLLTGWAFADEPTVKLTRLDDRVRIEMGGELFTEYLFEGNNKPILYPVIGPHGISMTRNFPMKEVAGEAKDHKHHRSLWFTHGDVNGHDFWSEKDDSGKTVHDTFLKIKSGEKGVLKTFNRWVDSSGKVQCTDTRTITFQVIADTQVIDYEVTLHASHGKVVLGDTKEGTMGIRTHPNLRLKNSRGVTTANGKSLNSEGVEGPEMWGKRAKWVDYWGTVDGKTVGVAIFDHPKNPRHPTWWHARDYGLVSANAFGVHNFEKKPKGTGDFAIEAGDTATFRYRFLFHEGDSDKGRVAWQYHQFAGH